MTISRLARTKCALGVWIGSLLVQGLTPTASAETIRFLAPAQVLPGQPFSFLVDLINNTTPLYGYALDVNITGEAGFVGTITGRVPPAIPASNFYPSQNLIAAGGRVLGPASTINLASPGPGGHRGLDVIAFNQTLDNVALAAPGHNVLAQLVFDVSASASGSFTLNLGDMGSSLYSVTGDIPQIIEVPFTFQPVTIQVVPEPGHMGLLGAAYLLLGRRRHGTRD
ncbi:MAG: hypothetical protein V2A79_03150 [Planctomycetota bacterium]